MTANVETNPGYLLNTKYLLFYLILLLATILWLIHRWHQSSRIFILGQKIPGPPPVPFFGNALLVLGLKPDQILPLAVQCAKIYGSVVRAWLGHKLIVFLTTAEDVEVILNSQVHINKSSDYSFFKPWLGDGLLISSGQKWSSHRKMIAPTFHINILKSFMDVFNQNSRAVVQKLKAETGKTFDVHDYMAGATVDILLETAMGITRETKGGSGYDYAMAVMKMCDIIHQRHYKFWMRVDAIFKLTPFFRNQVKLLQTIHGLTNKVIQIRKEAYLENKARGVIPLSIDELTKSTTEDESDDTKTFSDTVFKGYRDDLDLNDENDIGAKKRLAFLDLMIESAQNGTNNISDHEIKEEVDTIMFEGHDTTAAGASFVLCMLGNHQDIQSRVYDELHEIFGDSDRPATFADTLQMKYLERVILETLRLYPPVPIIARQLATDVKIATNDYVIPASSAVSIAIYKVHRDPKYFEDPEVFNPDNFLPEVAAARHYYSFIPFSAGPRSCVGRKYAMLKLKVLLSTIIRNFKSISEVSEKQFQLRGDIILKRSDGFMLRLEPRTKLSSA